MAAIGFVVHANSEFTRNPFTMVVIFFAFMASITALMMTIILVKYCHLWLRAYMSRAPIAYMDFFSMLQLRIPASLIASTRIEAAKAGIDLPVQSIQDLYLSTGRDAASVSRVVDNLIRIHKAGASADFNDLRRLCLLGGNIDEVAEATVHVKQAGLDVPFNDFAQHHMNGGNPVNVAKALAIAARSKMTLNFADAARIDRGEPLHAVAVENGRIIVDMSKNETNTF